MSNSSATYRFMIAPRWVRKETEVAHPVEECMTEDFIMTPEWVQSQIDDMVTRAGEGRPADDSAMHEAEDVLHQRVLKAIAMGAIVDAGKCCQIALLTQRMEFTRYYD